MTWHPIADDQRVRAELLDGRLVEMKDLLPGDIFRSVAPDGRTYVHPYNHEEDPFAYGLVVDLPVKATDVNEHNQSSGYAVKVLVAPLKYLQKQKATVHQRLN
jgi:hypothetical protein